MGVSQPPSTFSRKRAGGFGATPCSGLPNAENLKFSKLDYHHLQSSERNKGLMELQNLNYNPAFPNLCNFI